MFGGRPGEYRERKSGQDKENQRNGEKEGQQEGKHGDNNLFPDVNFEPYVRVRVVVDPDDDREKADGALAIVESSWAEDALDALGDGVARLARVALEQVVEITRNYVKAKVLDLLGIKETVALLEAIEAVAEAGTFTESNVIDLVVALLDCAEVVPSGPVGKVTSQYDKVAEVMGWPSASKIALTATVKGGRSAFTSAANLGQQAYQGLQQPSGGTFIGGGFH
jgi:hypothetical protein